LALSLIVLVLNDPLSALTREPVPHVGLQIFHFSRQLTALSCVLFVFQDFPHGGPASPLPVFRSRARPRLCQMILGSVANVNFIRTFLSRLKKYRTE